MTIDELKEMIIKGSIEPNLYTSKNEDGKDVIVCVDSDGFEIKTPQDNNFTLCQIYEYVRQDNTWTYSETYE